jgi:hypothetical protein
MSRFLEDNQKEKIEKKIQILAKIKVERYMEIKKKICDYVSLYGLTTEDLDILSGRCQADSYKCFLLWDNLVCHTQLTAYEIHNWFGILEVTDINPWLQQAQCGSEYGDVFSNRLPPWLRKIWESDYIERSKLK